MKAVDLFAGAGGSSTGLRAAGVEVVWAANHWQRAVDVHTANHPDVRHECQDLSQADFGVLPQYDLLWASPACQGHSNAASGGGRHESRGSAPSHDALRATAWATVAAAEAGSPRFAVVENTLGFSGWCGNPDHPTKPKCRCGGMFRAWLCAWEAMGYTCVPHVIDSADVGVPQSRKRLYLVFARGRKLDLGQPEGYKRATMREFLDLGAGQWRRLGDLRWEGPKRRARRSIERNGFTDAFYTQSVTGHAGRTLDGPAPTVTTKHQMGWVKGSGRWEDRLYRAWNLADYKAAMGFAPDYAMPGVGVWEGCQMLGNAVTPPVARWIAEQIERVA